VVLFGTVGGLVVATVAAFWAIVKLLRFRLSKDDVQAQQQADKRLDQVTQLYYALLVVVVLLEFLPGIVRGVTNVVNFFV